MPSPFAVSWLNELYALFEVTMTAGEFERSLTVFAVAGLSNRLKVLVTGLAVAAATQRRFRMLWPVTAECGAGFQALFANDWDVITVPEHEVAQLPYVHWATARLPDLLVAEAPNLVVGHDSWLLRPAHFEGHDATMSLSVEYFARLAPIPMLEDRIATFKTNHFRERMIGVHVRRGDWLRARADTAGGTKATIQAVDTFIQEWPDAGVLLCTDDGALDPKTRKVHTEGVVQRFEAHYGERLVRHKARTLDRSKAEAIQDGLIDLWLLRSTHGFVGTSGSTFTTLATLGRSVPHTLIAAPTSGYGRYRQLARIIGAQRVLTWLRRRGLVRNAPLPALLDYYYSAVARAIAHPTVTIKRKFDGTQH